MLAELERCYPEAHCALNYQSPWQLLVATILSAQCTDVRVNLVTAHLFQRFPMPADYIRAGEEAVAEVIRSVGCFRTKARSLVRTAQIVCAEYGGEVPQDMAALVALPGVGRKTANVVRGDAFGLPGMVVDTHVKRLAYRMGWTRQTEPEKIETALMRLLPEEKWTRTGHTLIAHGRAVCKAPTPHCSLCPVVQLCPRRGVTRSH